MGDGRGGGGGTQAVGMLVQAVVTIGVVCCACGCSWNMGLRGARFGCVMDVGVTAAAVLAVA